MTENEPSAGTRSLATQAHAPTVTLRSITAAPPTDAEGMLLELGTGEQGFNGTSVGSGDATLSEFVAESRRNSSGEEVPAGRVPSTTHWILANGKSAGLLRLRHYLNDSLRHKGGHIGYYVRPAWRGKGVATKALAEALPLAHALGEASVMLTTNPDNPGSIKVIEANGGVLKATVPDDTPNTTILQYWINRAELGN